MTANLDLRPLSPLRTIARIVLGVFLLFAGAAHLFFARAEFAAQVPAWMPLDTDFVVVASGIVEVALGAALVFLPRWRVHIGWIVAAFFVAVFPGNIAQYVDGVDAFGLDTDGARLIRLFFQPALIAWALWSTGAWRDRGLLRKSSERRGQ
ncbi:DoxX family membrane protein [Arthrobacter sp. H20]|uniref:DoxX family protein n=1 Tax=Arthrobacter sp. H20 TaxID=1267981 RepID=UPI0004B70E58|nr:DoxX family membrane protein [Arthrobacter sp. H20]